MMILASAADSEITNHRKSPGVQRICDSRSTSTPFVYQATNPPRSPSLDDTSWSRPTRHIWTRSKQPWITFADGDEIFEAQSPA